MLTWTLDGSDVANVFRVDTTESLRPGCRTFSISDDPRIPELPPAKARQSLRSARRRASVDESLDVEDDAFTPWTPGFGPRSPW